MNHSVYLGSIVLCKLVGISVCLTSPIEISGALENLEFIEKLADFGGSKLLDINESGDTDLYLL